MIDASPIASADDRRIIEEEEVLLARALAALDAARERARENRASDLRSLDAFRELQDEAKTASADDLPPLLLELNVRKRLLELAANESLPDRAQPYLAHLRLHEAGERRDYLLGKASYLDPARGVRIVDWRVAPVAQIFYRYREGEDYEEHFPGRVAEGVVGARRIVVITGGELTTIIGDGLVLTRDPDGTWRRRSRDALAFEAGGAGSAARPGILGVGAGHASAPARPEVTALLDAEQFAAITAPPDEPLLVLGSAGSGKTTVALHRLARIAEREPERYPLAQMGVLVPEEGLARLARRLLEPLGVGAAQVKTLDAWATELARRAFGEALPRLTVDAPALVSSLKRHPALFDALRRRFAGLGKEKVSMKRLHRRLVDAFTDRAFLSEVVEAAQGTLPRGAVEETVRHTLLQIAEPPARELRSVTDRERRRALDHRAVWDATPEELAGTYDLEDLPILLSLSAPKARLVGSPTQHLVIDEAEDASLFELFVAGEVLSTARSLTLAGDEAQQTSSAFAGWPRALEVAGAEGARTCRLAVSYRCPRPVTELAREILGRGAPEAHTTAAHDGAPVGRFSFPSREQAHLFVAGALRDLVEREPRASVGVITHDGDAARAFFELVREVPQARLVLDGEFSFESGVDVTDVDSAKGLEFDYVVVPDATADVYPETDDARRRLHVAVTRTSHQLWLVSGGPPSKLAFAKA